MELKMPVNAYYFLLKSVPCEEPLLLPEHTVTQEDVAQAYVEARQLWLDSGWAEMDLDGSIRPSVRLARLLHIISHREAVLRWTQEGKREYFVKGLVDVLHVAEKDGEVTLIQRDNLYPLRRIRGKLHSAGLSGTVEVAHTSGEKTDPVTADGLTAKETPESIALAKLMMLFYEGVVRGA